MDKVLNILKWTAVSILIVAASIRMAYVDSERKEHLLTCKDTYITHAIVGRAIVKLETCKHYN